MSRTDKASLVVSASREEVYGALVDREALAEWLPPDGMSGISADDHAAGLASSLRNLADYVRG